MTIAIYPGSFDPITNGHIDILTSATKMFEKVIIAVTYNSEKKAFIPIEDRQKIICECTKNFRNVEVHCFEELTVDFAKKVNASVIIRGIRNSLDYEYEMQLAYNNHNLNPNIQTIFIPSTIKNSFVSSSAVREILHYKGDISTLVPDAVAKYLNYDI